MAAGPAEDDHFPSRLHQFVWRNWELANLDRLASVVRGTPKQVSAIAASMGLPAKRPLSEDQLRRIYITVIRQNWRLLPEAQIIELLGWDEARFRFTLKEDDFLDVKLGAKPACEPLRYAPPGAAERRRAAEIRALIARRFGAAWKQPGEERFAFVRELSTRAAGSWRDPDARPESGEADLGRGCTVVGSEELRRFLEERMGVREAPAHRLEFVLEERPERRPEWTIEVRTAATRVTANSPAAQRRAEAELTAEMERREAPFLALGQRTRREVWSPRYLYSYFALYGDPLLEGDAAGLPDAYFERAAAAGVTGVWIQAVLNTLAASPAFPEFGAGGAARLANLRALVERAARHGLKIYLYLNEPRAMPAAFFASRPEMRGTVHQGLYALCTSTPAVQDWLRSSIAHVFREVPGLGGLFSITMSENHTNCFSHGGAWGDRYPAAGGCPRCSRRKPEEVLAELIACFRDGVRAASPAAEVISYDWGWGTPLAEALIPKLPRDSAVLSISEWSQPVARGGVETIVGEYSMSVPGPGPRARRNWRLAREHGLRTIAKTQFNNTWEISAVPWIPVLPLVIEHCQALAAEGIDGLMPSWTCGGYPSANLRAAAAFAAEPRPEAATVLREEAERTFGRAAAAEAIAAWQVFSRAFRQFPYGVAIYLIPTQHGPANLLRLQPTGLAPGMILFPHDAYRRWCGAYPPGVVRSQFRALAAGWREGLDSLGRAVERASPRKKRAAQRELAIAFTCLHHFESVANQIEFYLLRDGGGDRARMLELLEAESELAVRQFAVARTESLIGYEASNHYYYTPLDLAEKVLNCDWIARRIGRR